MTRKTVAILIALFLCVLFLSTFGSFLTGFAVLDNEEITLKNYHYPFIKNNVPNSLYIVIPYAGEPEEYAAYTRIARSLKLTNPLPPEIVTDKEVPEGAHNLIIIGDPCNNELIAKELNTNKCNIDLRKGEGLLKLINHDRTSTLVVSGYSPDDITKASVVLANSNFYPLRGKEIRVVGKVGSLSLYYY